MTVGYKTGGRQKGTPNKKTQALTILVEQYLGKSLPESILDDIAQCDPKDRVDAKIKLMPYLYAIKKPIDDSLLPPGVDINFIQQVAVFLSMPRDQINELLQKKLNGTIDQSSSD